MYNIEDQYYAPSSKIISLFRSEWCVSHKSKTIFITINKCSGTSLREYLKAKGFRVINNLAIDDDKIRNFIEKQYTFYSIVRDPEDRYVSGLNQFMNCYLKTYFKNNLSYIENNLKENKFIFDEHTIPQYKSLHQAIDLAADIKLISMKNNLGCLIPRLINCSDEMPNYNKTSDKKNNYYDFCVSMFSKYCRNNIKFKNLYQVDFDLFSSSKLFL